MNKRYPVDVICLHSKEGNIIPIRIRVEDEEGFQRGYKIAGYMKLTGDGGYTTTDGVFVKSDTIFYECRIEVLGKTMKIRLYYSDHERNWFMTVL
ncbi:MAG TPA: hypothetical protein DCW44_02315 [Eubacterium sp.]|nr:hypothetical protein [Eubacterium sp.]